MKNYFIADFQVGYCNAFMNKYGTDAFIDVLTIFEKNGSLGHAMIQVVNQIQQEKK